MKTMLTRAAAVAATTVLAVGAAMATGPAAGQESRAGGASAQSRKSGAGGASAPKQQQIARGKYVVQIAGCNDCHTAGYAMSGGKVAEAQWLTGDRLGWRGPWGTTYAVNLRLYMAGLTESQWLKRAKSLQTRPPMPWFALRDMSEPDLKALYHYVRSLGGGGEAAPAYVAPDREPSTPYVQFPAVPK